MCINSKLNDMKYIDARKNCFITSTDSNGQNIPANSYTYMIFFPESCNACSIDSSGVITFLERYVWYYIELEIRLATDDMEYDIDLAFNTDITDLFQLHCSGRGRYNTFTITRYVFIDDRNFQEILVLFNRSNITHKYAYCRLGIFKLI